MSAYSEKRNSLLGQWSVLPRFQEELHWWVCRCTSSTAPQAMPRFIRMSREKEWNILRRISWTAKSRRTSTSELQSSLSVSYLPINHIQSSNQYVDVLNIPHWWAQCTIARNIVFWREHDSGGHFAASEKPDLLVEDIRDFAKVINPSRMVALVKSGKLKKWCTYLALLALTQKSMFRFSNARSSKLYKQKSSSMFEISEISKHVDRKPQCQPQDQVLVMFSRLTRHIYLLIDEPYFP